MTREPPISADKMRDRCIDVALFYDRQMVSRPDTAIVALRDAARTIDQLTDACHAAEWWLSTLPGTEKIRARLRAAIAGTADPAKPPEEPPESWPEPTERQPGEAVTADHVRSVVRASGRSWWTLRACSICDRPVGYSFAATDPAWDGSCDCTPTWTPPETRTWEEVAEHFNMQSAPTREAEWDRFLKAFPKARPADWIDVKRGADAASKKET
jgi:hypothetical protein